MPTFHLTFTTRGRQPMTPGEAERRAAVRALVRVGGAWIALFSLVDEHAHVVVRCDTVGPVARSLHMTLAANASAPVLPAHVEPVDTRGHLQNLVRYALTQVDHHALRAHPATWSGSCFADLVGARVLPGWRDHLAEALPRFGPGEAWKAVGLDACAPVADAALKELGLSRIVAAAADAVAADPALPGRTAEVVAARRVAITLGRLAGFGPGAIGEALGITPRGVTLLGSTPADEALLRAARVRLAVDLALTERGAVGTGERAVVRGRK